MATPEMSNGTAGETPAKRGRPAGSSPIKASFATAIAIVAEFREEWAKDADGENVVGCLDKITARLQVEHDKDRTAPSAGSWYSTGKGGEAFKASDDASAAEHAREAGATACYGPFAREVAAHFCVKHGNLTKRFPIVYEAK